MTEKRFNWDTIDRDVIFYDNGAMIDYDDVVDLLNELSDENEQLKQKIKDFEAQLYCENEDGVCLICNNHYLVKGKTHDKYYISKCKKGHDECSTEILMVCKDFELKGDVE